MLQCVLTRHTQFICHQTKWHLGIMVIQQAKSTNQTIICVAHLLSPFSLTSTFIITLH